MFRSASRLLSLALLSAALCSNTCCGEALSFSWRAITSGTLGPNQDFAESAILGGEGDFSSIVGLPTTSQIAGNGLNFFFAHSTLGEPALTLDELTLGGTTVQRFVATPGGFFELRVGDDVVAVGKLVEVVIVTPAQNFTTGGERISTGYGTLQLTGSGEGDPAIFDELWEASGETGIFTMSITGFPFDGTPSQDFPGTLEFSSQGALVPSSGAGTDPNNPLSAVRTLGTTSEFDLSQTPADVLTYFSQTIPTLDDTGFGVTGIDFCTEGNSFSSVVLPDLGNAVYELHRFNGSDFVFERTVNAGEQVTFPANTREFRVLGTDANNTVFSDTFIPALSFSDSGGSLNMKTLDDREPLNIRGTQGPDDIFLQQAGNTLFVDVNGVVTTHELPSISRVEIFSFGGGDTIEVAAAVRTFISAGFGPDFIRGGRLENEIQGGPGPDVIFGGPLADQINAGRGRDTVSALGGDDIILGADADDMLFGGSGNDDIQGGLGADEIDGGPGDDDIQGNTGGDTLIGGGGNDLLIGQGGPDNISGGPGDDILSGGEGFDVLDGGNNFDIAVDRGEVEISIED